MKRKPSCSKQRLLFLGWGAAAAEALLAVNALEPMSESDSARRSVVPSDAGDIKFECLVITHEKQSDDVDLRELSRERGLQCLTVGDENHDDILLARAEEFQPDLVLCASYRKRVPREVLD
ncbi:hypothetical protein FOZ63_019554, partial [Perkinsus olseni]